MDDPSDHAAPSAKDIIAVLAMPTTMTRSRLALGAAGAFFIACGLTFVIALILTTATTSLAWILPVSLLVAAAVCTVFIRWGAASMMYFTADRAGTIRVRLGRNALRYMARTIGRRRNIAKQLLVGFGIVAAAVAVIIVAALLGASQSIALALGALPLGWIMAVIGFFVLRTAISARPADTPLMGQVVAPLVGAYLNQTGAPVERAVSGIPADELVRTLSASSFDQAAEVARFLARFH